MSAKTSIEWTQRTWNPLVAYLNRDVKVTRKNGEVVTVPAGTRGWFCTKCSPGCAHCYAEKINLRLGNGLEYSTKNLAAISFELVNLDAPLKWRKPQMVFVNSMTDLFHESVPDELIDQVFVAMAASPKHTFQVLTKRSKRMREYMSEPSRLESIYNMWHAVSGGACEVEAWPLPNVWLGVSVENQTCAEERIPLLLETPAVVRFLSCEPLLGPVDLSKWLSYSLADGGCSRCGFLDSQKGHARHCPAPQVDWIICGGESGPKARPMHPDWARSLRDQCVHAGVPFFFKQWGEWALEIPRAGGDLGGDLRRSVVDHVCRDRKNDGHYRQGDCYMRRVGKKRAGRLLDGREWNEMPTPAGEAPRSKLQDPGKHQAPSSNDKESNGKA